MPTAGSPLGMALVSLGGEFIQLNASLCRLLGASAEEVTRPTAWRFPER